MAKLEVLHLRSLPISQQHVERDQWLQDLVKSILRRPGEILIIVGHARNCKSYKVSIETLREVTPSDFVVPWM